MKNILFLCTGNSSRSIMAEAILGRIGKGRFRAYSAGSQDVGEPNPWAILLLESFGYDVGRLRSKNWSEFAREGCPEMDHIITVCDHKVEESCPVWPGHPAIAHWGIANPAEEVGDDKDMQLAFLTTYAQLSDRIGRFVSLPIETMSEDELMQTMREIGDFSGTTQGRT
ncbi:arsenate reductase ArsC [uncultured Cohaesibacter sp.]|uniref:arsenate reductase ArsC n=1 Tax=uncultured Cohaesibacter sp. TaxID=1002546 RepID=UPI00292E43E6|nr:arsenate reductase ArsC [uncultured Cohaesibacter sp.]